MNIPTLSNGYGENGLVARGVVFVPCSFLFICFFLWCQFSLLTIFSCLVLTFFAFLLDALASREILNEFGDEDQQRFLRFSWGRTRLPLVEQGWTHRFVVSTSHIAKEFSQDKFLPEASTCFFQLNLPEYSSKMIMKERLLFAITYCSSIDMDA